MSELSKETDALLAKGRGGEALGGQHKARLKRAVLSQIAGATVVATTSTAAAWTTATAAKVIGAVVIVGSVAGGIAAVVPARSAPVKTTMHASVATVARAETAPRSVPAAPPAVAQTPAPPIAPAPPPASDRPSADIARPLASPAPAPSSSLDAEARLLREADEALKAGDTALALRMLDEHARAFPHSALVPERVAERVFVLCVMERKDEARRAAGDFLRIQPEGPLASRVRASCGGSGQ
jgi:hypothetical protein